MLKTCQNAVLVISKCSQNLSASGPLCEKLYGFQFFGGLRSQHADRMIWWYPTSRRNQSQSTSQDAKTFFSTMLKKPINFARRTKNSVSKLFNFLRWFDFCHLESLRMKSRGCSSFMFFQNTYNAQKSTFAQWIPTWTFSVSCRDQLGTHTKAQHLLGHYRNATIITPKVILRRYSNVLKTKI